MKLTCDLCDGSLQVNSGGKSASCVNCGLTYSMERLREKMTADSSAVEPETTPEPPIDPKPAAESDPIAAPAAKRNVYDTVCWEQVEPSKPAPKTEPLKPAKKDLIYDTVCWEKVEPSKPVPDPTSGNPVKANQKFYEVVDYEVIG